MAEQFKEHFNRLDPEVAELFAILAEECGEVVQRIGKILRHGIRPDPYTGILNRESLEEELTDVQAIIGALDQLDVLSWERIRSGIPEKLKRLTGPEILHHSTIFTPEPCVRCGSIKHAQIRRGPNSRSDGPVCHNIGDCLVRQG